MQLKYVLSIGLLSLGLLAPVPVLRAEDAPAKDAPADAPKHTRGGMLERLHKSVLKLTLTDDQKPKIEAAFADAKTKVAAAVKDAAGDKDAIKAKVGPIVKELVTAVEGVLTDDQKAEWKKARESHKPKAPPASN